MRKTMKLISFVLTVCLLAGMLPVTVKAEGHADHMLCGGAACTGTGHTCSAVTTFTEWTATDSLPAAAGAYYLSGDVALTSTWEVTADITLCLNGHTIQPQMGTTLGTLVLIYNQGKLTLTDCGSTGKLTNPTGQIVEVGTDGGDEGTLLLYNGSITGGRIDENTYVGGMRVYGAGICVERNTEFYMYGGSITDNCNTKKDSAFGALGGGVYVNGKFYMYGGSITGNTAGNQETGANASTGRGGGVFAAREFHMYGGSITGNTVYGTGAKGGGVSCYSGLHVSGNVVISGNNVGTSAGNVYLYSDGEIKLEGAGLGANARIGVATQKQPTATESVTIVSAGADSCIGKLFNDVNGNILAVSGGAVKLYIITLSDGAAVRDSEAAATVTFTGSAAGSCYYQVVESGAAVPAIDTTGTGISCISGENRISIAGLSDAEAKDVYLCVKDEYGVVSNVLKVEIPVYAVPPEITGVVDGAVCCGSVTVTVADAASYRITVNDVAVTPDANNQFTLSPAEGVQKIVVTDKAGRPTTINVTVHALTHQAAVAATVLAPGNAEYWYCAKCGKYFADAQGTTAVTQEATVTPMLAPEIIDGQNQTVTAGAGSTLTFRSNAAFADFIRVELDGETVDEGNYTKREGSTIITLNAEFVAGIPAGTHQLGIVSRGGTAVASFEVTVQAADGGETSPKTGDTTPFMWVIAILLCGCGVYVISRSVGRKQG